MDKQKGSLIIVLFIFGSTLLILFGTATGVFKGDMTGTVINVNREMKSIEVDITEWYMPKKSGPRNAIAYIYTAIVDEQTVLRYEDGRKATLQNVKEGQKVRLIAPKELTSGGTVAKQVIILEQ